QKYYPVADGALAAANASRVLHQAREQLDEYFTGERHAFTVPLRMLGSAFQRDVWDQLVQIPYGETASYGSIARRLG
ncbi:MGMT family protein, partial [Paraburkholderia sp. SIMBA_050]